jgi:hypothetical protein
VNEQKNPQELLLKDIAVTLKSIRGWITFFGIVVILALIGGCLITAEVYGGTASIVASFKSPCPTAYGIDYHNGYLYHADGLTAGYIYETDTTGSVTRKIRNLTGARGVDRMPSDFWTCNYDAWVHRLSTTGSVLSSFRAWQQGYGITFGGGYLWYTQYHYVFKVTLTGSIVRSFTITGLAPSGICWDTPYLWIANLVNHNVYLTTQGGGVIDKISIPCRPYGVTWDGSHIWFSGVNHWVYRARVCFTAVAPVSLGRVKALYR